VGHPSVTSDPGVVRLRTRADITLGALGAVGWDGAGVEIAGEAVEFMDRAHESFAEWVEGRVRADPDALIYGVTSAPGDRAFARLGRDQEGSRPTQLWTAASFGDPLPTRVVRGILLARLANFLDGHAAVRGHTALAVAAMLEHDPVPRVPIEGNGGSGEVLALGSLFYELSRRLSLTPKERMALINGSPCAAALVADVALSARRRLDLAESVFALAAEVAGIPDEHLACELEHLWGDEHETAALRSLRRFLSESSRPQQRHQAAVSLRILPRVLGAARRALKEAEDAATVSLASVTDNPVYLPPDLRPTSERVLSTGGFHNARATPAMDAVMFSHADLCQLAQRLTDHLFQQPATAALINRDEWTIKPIHMAQTGWAEQARAVASPTLLSLGGFGQNDVPALSFLAWQKAMRVGRCLNATLGGLAVVASQALYVADRALPPRLQTLVARIRDVVPPVTEPRALGRDCDRLIEAIEDDTFR
jgi:histidine ammonia-lyase